MTATARGTAHRTHASEKRPSHIREVTPVAVRGRRVTRKVVRGAVLNRTLQDSRVCG